MPDANEYDPKLWEEIKQRTSDLESDYSAWKDEAKEYEDILLVRWTKDTPKKKGDDVKLTVSPDASNRLIGASRLLTATNAQINIRYQDATDDEKKASGAVEKYLRAIWSASSRTYGRPLESDIVLSALTYADVHVGARLVSDMLAQAEDLADGPTRERQIRRLNAIAEETAVIHDIFNPRGGMAEYDSLGLSAYVREWPTTPSKLISEWPEAIGDLHQVKRGTRVTVKEYVDDKYRCLWYAPAGSKGADKRLAPFFLREHNAKCVPVVANIIEGSKLFDLPHEQRRPFLYAMVKSGLWNRMNLVLTVLYTTVFSVAALAYWKHQRGTTDTDLRIEHRSSGLGVAELGPGEDLQPMIAKGAIDPALMQAYQEAKNLAAESTIHGQALGEPLGSNAPYSMVALLHQAGRLPLVTPQKLCGWAIEDVLRMTMRLLKADGKAPSVMHNGRKVAVKGVSDLDWHLPLEVILDIDLPQDWPQLATVAMNLIEGELASRRFIREKIMHMGDSEGMDDEIWDEGAANAFYKAMLQTELSGVVQGMVAQAGGMPGQQPPPGQEPPPGGAGLEGPAPTGAPMPEQPPAGPREPLTAPLPPRGQA